MQGALHEPQPQAVPYAAAVVDPELSDRADLLDQGIEHGLATAEATDQADIAYTHQGEPAVAAVPQPAKPAGEDVEASNDVPAAADQRKDSADKPAGATQVHTFSAQNCHEVTRFVHALRHLKHIRIHIACPRATARHWLKFAWLLTLLLQAKQDHRLPADAMQMQALLSLDSQKRNNIHIFDDNTVLTSAGTHVILLDLRTCIPQYITTPVASGIGALAASTDSR